MSAAQMHRKALRLFPSEQDLLRAMSEQMGRSFGPEELDALRESFFTDAQRAYLTLTGYTVGIYPPRKKFRAKLVDNLL